MPDSPRLDFPSPVAPRMPYLGLGSEAALRTMADVLPYGVFTTDLGGRVTSWNRAAERISGWTRAEALGRDCSILAGDAVHGCACGVGPIRCGLVEQGRTSKTCTLRTKDGRLLLIVKNAVPLAGTDGEMVGALESFAEVGEAGFEPRRAAVAVGEGDFCGMIGRSPPMQELFATVGRVAQSDATVMLLGESGTGKECVAAAIHQASRRAGGPFVKVSCSALNENLLESELFGHVKGAFTGAVRDRRGRFQEAHGGTLLLDEIGDVSPAVQVKLLRVIEQREVERVGESVPIRVDVRLVCATHRDLKALVQEGRFRADLYFRLAVFPIRIPPLRERIEDLPRIAEEHLGRLVRAGGVRAGGLSPEALEVMSRYPWPGNVRELQNALEFGALRAHGGLIEPAHLPEDLCAPPPSSGERAAPVPPAEEAPRLTEGPEDRARAVAVLDACGWNRAEAARRLGVSRVTLWKRLKAWGLEGR